jgi:chitinase
MIQLRKLNLAMMSIIGVAIAGCNSGIGSNPSASNASTNNIAKVANVKAPTTAPAPSGASFDYIAPFKDYNNKITLSINGLTSAEMVSFTANFTPEAVASAGWGLCFGQNRYNLSITTTQSGNNYITTIADNDGLHPLDLTGTCDIMGTDSNVILKSASGLNVTDPIVYSMNISESPGLSYDLAINHPCGDCKDPGKGYVDAGYYAQWSVWGRAYNPYTMPFNNINDIIYAFIGFDPATGNLLSLDAQADSWGLAATSRAVQQYPYMQAHLSFGGWTNNGVNTAPMFAQLASSTASMQNFADQAVALMQKTGLTGIDIDWEWWSDYGNDVAPAQQQLAFFKILRTTIDNASIADGKHYTLTIATSVGKDKINALSDPTNPNSVPDFWSQVSGLVDHINVMSYDMHGAYDTNGPAYFQAAWKMNDDNPYLSTGYDVVTGLNTYLSNGVPANKLVAGVPIYGRSMAVSSLGNDYGLYANVTGAGFGDYDAGIMDYKCIVNPVLDPVNGCGSQAAATAVQGLGFIDMAHDTNGLWTTYSATTSYEPWAYNTDTFVTYDDVYSATMKTRAAKNMGLGGMMTWELDGDATTSNKSLVQAIKNELNN